MLVLKPNKLFFSNLLFSNLLLIFLTSCGTPTAYFKKTNPYSFKESEHFLLEYQNDVFSKIKFEFGRNEHKEYIQVTSYSMNWFFINQIEIKIDGMTKVATLDSPLRKMADVEGKKLMTESDIALVNEEVKEAIIKGNEISLKIIGKNGEREFPVSKEQFADLKNNFYHQKKQTKMTNKTSIQTPNTTNNTNF